MMYKQEHLKLYNYIIFTFLVLATMVVCIGIGNVDIPFYKVVEVIGDYIKNGEVSGSTGAIIISVRLPRVILVALVGASLSFCGASMQGLLRNPLADGSTLGVSAGASLGAVISIAFGVKISAIPLAGTVVMSIVFAFFSILLVLVLANRLDYNISTNTLILLGVIYSMFVSSITSFIIVFASNKIESITFWSMGSFAGSSYKNALIILLVLVFLVPRILLNSKALDAFSIGERNAENIGINVKKVKLDVMLCVSAIIGVCVAFTGTIGFVGLIMPHILRKFVGPSHNKLLPISMFGGSIFLLLADLISRTVLRPIELPIGVVTSFVGSILFVYIYYNMRKVR